MSSKKRLQEEIAPYFESDTPITDVTKTGHPKSKVLFPLGRLSTAERRRFLQTEQGRAAAKTKENLSRIEDTGEYAPPRAQIAREIGLGRGTQDITDADVADLLEYIGKTEYLKRSEGGQIKPRGVGKALRGWGNKEKRQKGGQIMTKRNRMSRVGLSPAEEARAGTQSEAERRRYNKGGDVKVAGRGSKKGKPSRPKPQKPPKMFAQDGGRVLSMRELNEILKRFRDQERSGQSQEDLYRDVDDVVTEERRPPIPKAHELIKSVKRPLRRKKGGKLKQGYDARKLVRRAKGGPIGIRAALRGHGAVRKS